MSESREEFVRAARSGDWMLAFMKLNGLRMYEMLCVLADLPADLRDDLGDQSACWGFVDMPRITFAMTVATSGDIPPEVPAVLRATGQVREARAFLAERVFRPRAPSMPPKSRAGWLFPSADAAAVAAIEDVLPISVANRWEYAGRILQVKPKGLFLFTRPNTDRKAFEAYAGPKVLGYVNVGTYRTHALGAEAEDFSLHDRWEAWIAGETAYLGTPRGTVLRFTPPQVLRSEEELRYAEGNISVVRAAKACAKNGG